MTFVATILLALSLTIASTVFTQAANAAESDHNSEKITLFRGGSIPSAKGSADFFTGDVTIDQFFPAQNSLEFSGGYVTFAPSARTTWHTHPQGQLLIITAGSGRVQQWGAPVLHVTKGDIVWFPANVKHWHGATPDTAMTHIALLQTVAGNGVEWMEHVTDAQYENK